MMMLTMMFLSLLFMFEFVMLKYYKLIIQNMMFLLTFYMFFLGHCDYYWSYINSMFMMGLDQYNYILIILLFWLMGVTYLGLSDDSGEVYLILLMLTLFVYLTFSMMNLVYFYFFFEVSLLPIFMLILVGGSNYSRVSSGLFMLMYTLIFSLPLLICLVSCFYEFNSLMIIYLIYENFLVDSVMYMMLILAFLVKMPMYSLHIWLPKAHVEAPCSGSMILAGILLKLGSYGLLRMMMMTLKISSMINIKIMFFSLLGSLICSIMCLRQSDLKMLIAYSSIVHMGVMLSGMMTLSLLGYLGSLYMMVGHGLCSSGLFYIVNVSYNRLHSRLIYVNKGLINIMPSMSLWWFLLCSSNMSAPISLNLLSEIYLMMSLVMFDKLMILILVFISLLSACYSICLFCLSQHGNLMGAIILDSGSMKEFLVIFLHWVPLNVLILNMALF